MEEFWFGLVAVAVAVSAYFLFTQYLQFRRSIYLVVYSNFLEYRMKCRSPEKMAESAWYRQIFGYHRIDYVVLESTGGAPGQAYMILTMSSGVYIINIKNYGGSISGGDGKTWTNTFTEGKKKKQRRIGNPVDETRRQTARVRELTRDWKPAIHALVVFQDCCELDYRGNECGIPVVKRSGLTEAVKTLQESRKGAGLAPDVIDAIHGAFLQK